MQSRESGLANVGGHCQGRPVFGYSFGSTFCGLGSPYSFILQAAGWSCTWDFRSLHYINAGLQNGSLLVFDMRQTVGPVNSLNGLTRNPVHMADSILHSSTLTSSVSSVLSASSICLYQWNFDGAEE
ncbi:uncharacterized protein LOC126691910 isoform X3 [Quercus robur]|uniref:uncharacterized protein LOC126691910 isoform X3 n=1 Tax=Quercus robur TaxID=38942 RepID=UPI0021613D9C|nr:uncharacterized protein LOC126691910 isoform X3 [Quercus robur]XP_050243208.1 uncharacterized protein LOC126691910 isoform X3 [Quercus robur]XP_050243209.1 uncharacterized protein LOC126691910 isoform X3 [Quercus robur]